MVLVRSARTTGAELVVTAAAAWAPARGAGLPSTIAAATAARTVARPATAPARRRDRPGSRSAVMAQARQRRGRDLGVEQRPAGLRGPLEDRARLAAGRHLAGGHPEAVAGRVRRPRRRVRVVRQAVRPHALRGPYARLDQLRRRRRLVGRAQSGRRGQRAAGLLDRAERGLGRILDAAAVAVDAAAGGEHGVGVGRDAVLPDALSRLVQRGGAGGTALTGTALARGRSGDGLGCRRHGGRRRAPRGTAGQEHGAGPAGQEQGGGAAGRPGAGWPGAGRPRADVGGVSHRYLPDGPRTGPFGTSCRRRAVTPAQQAGAGLVMSLSSRPGHYGNVRVLVAEDHKVLADRIAEGLRDQGMAVDIAYDGEAALESTAVTGYDVIVLDRDLPRVHGDAVCASLVTGSAQARILMLTAAAAVGDRVDGLNLGADDYLGKPFAFTELVARVRALGRRSPSAPPVLFHGDLAIDRVRRRVSRGGRPVMLTRKEFGVLEELAAAGGGVVSAEDLLERVWDEYADPFSNTVSVTLSRLRRKLGSPSPIETVIGCGYRLRDAP